MPQRFDFSAATSHIKRLSLVRSGPGRAWLAALFGLSVVVGCVTQSPAPQGGTPQAAAPSPTPTAQVTTTPPTLKGKVVYHSQVGADFQIFVLDLDARETKQITQTGNNTEPAWSPDGRQIVYSCKVANRQQLCTMQADGSGIRQLTNREFDNWGPAWSPDGKRILFVSNEVRPATMYYYDFATEAVTIVIKGGNNEGAPKWSPDGSRVMFAGNRKNTYSTFFIYTVKADGTDEQQVSKSGRDDRPAWSPDGKLMAYRREVVASSMFSGVEVMVANIDGSNERQLTNNQATDDWPEFSPDGKWIVYTSEANNDTYLYVIPVDGGSPAPIIPGGVRGRAPHWHN